MQEANINYFYDKERYSEEEIVTSIECLHEGNPFVGTLVLTDKRLVFIRKGVPDFDVLVIKRNLIVNIDHRFDRGLDFILIVKLEKFSQEFELRAIDMASKQSFLDQAKEQLGPFCEGIPMADRDSSQNHAYK